LGLDYSGLLHTLQQTNSFKTARTKSTRWERTVSEDPAAWLRCAAEVAGPAVRNGAPGSYGASWIVQKFRKTPGTLLLTTSILFQSTAGRNFHPAARDHLHLGGRRSGRAARRPAWVRDHGYNWRPASNNRHLSKTKTMRQGKKPTAHTSIPPTFGQWTSMGEAFQRFVGPPAATFVGVCEFVGVRVLGNRAGRTGIQ